MGFTRFTKNVLNVSALPDRVQNQASTLKATFDQAGVDIKAALNALIAELEAATSANNIGADVASVTTKTVQAILAAFDERIADRYTKTETETLVANDTNNLVSDVDVNLTTGVITITKKDGTTVTFDTALEKVPAKFEIVENGDTYALKITNQDGTVTQADITQFMNVYNFNNSAEVAFEVNGSGNEKTVTASIRANSIGLDKLSLSIVSTLEGYMTSAKDSAAAAKTSETNARTSELNAQTAANTALNKASEATTAANTATSKASAAEKSAEDAEYWAKKAQESGGGSGGGITEIPVATADTLGGIKVGDGLEITEDGVLSAVGGSNTNVGEYGCYEVSAPSSTTEGSTLPITAIEGNIGVNNNCIMLKANKVYSVRVSCRQAVFSANDGTACIKLDKNDGTEVARLINMYSISNNSMIYVGGVDRLLKFAEDTEVRLSVLHWTSVASVHDLTFTVIEEANVGGNYIINGDELSVDATPTADSTNLVTSGGVKTYVDNKASLRKFVGTQENPIDFTDLFDGMGNATDGWHQGSALGNCVLSGYVKTANGAETLSSLIFGNAGLVAEIVVAYIYMYAEGVYDPPVLMCTVQNDVSLIGFTAIAGQGFAAFNGEAKLVTNDELNNRIQSSTTDLTAGTSELATGALYFVYE